MNIALVLSGGTGTRLGSDIPKQYIKVNNKMIISYCLETLINNDNIDYIQIVADKAWHGEIEQELANSKFKGFSNPGANRQLSIYNGLTDISKYADDDSYVLIHDAARPLLKDELINTCLKSVKGDKNNMPMEDGASHIYDGVLPVLPMKDTVYMSEDGKSISSLLDRSKIYAGQAPELFHLGKYYEANKALLPDKIFAINGSTEPAIMAGMNIAMIPGDEGNFKITTKADLDRFFELEAIDEV
ncbi:MAG: 2-C-methyl-D-erythritol 4-phosphate cytidylyltransferase [Lachnospiraceae bacterium]|nr:2-C-methyl-D-erythritol 4-phosphate cytidylyltransferase [Lachnospiraceae bacterium]